VKNRGPVDTPPLDPEKTARIALAALPLAHGVHRYVHEPGDQYPEIQVTFASAFYDDLNLAWSAWKSRISYLWLLPFSLDARKETNNFERGNNLCPIR
jgi:hypothetical protein